MRKNTLILLLVLLAPAALATVVMKTFDEPYEDRGLADNAITDIVYHKGGVWMTTGAGVCFSRDGGVTWLTYNSTNGLVSDGISAIYSAGDDIGDRLWLATLHSIMVGDMSVGYADGLTYTEDEGFTFDTIMPMGLTLPGLYGPDHEVYDIDGADSIIFATSKAGGLFGSFDFGETWIEYYATRYDSIADTSGSAPSLATLYFSVIVDTLHTDSVVVWAGSANGLKRMVWIKPWAKPASNYVSSTIKVDTTLFICGDNGLTKLEYDENNTELYHSTFESDGLPGRGVYAAYFLGGKLFAGTYDSLNGNGTGLAVSDDMGMTFAKIDDPVFDLESSNTYAKEFAEFDDMLYMAAYEGGLYRTPDTGLTWEKVTLDTLEATLASGRNIAHSLAPDTLYDRLWVGTDSGLVAMYPDGIGGFDSLQYFVFPEDDTSGARSYRVRMQEIYDSLGVLTDIRYWSINHPLTIDGNYTVYISMDTGKTFATQVEVDSKWRNVVTPLDTPYYDIDFLNAFVGLTGKNIYNQRLAEFSWGYRSGESINDSVNILVNLGGANLLCYDIIDSTLYIGSDTKGFALSPPSGRYRIVYANTNHIRQDSARVITSAQLSGGWIPVLGLQVLPEGEPLIWAHSRPNSDGQYHGVFYSELNGKNWNRVDSGTVVWNFEFSDSLVFMATSDGLRFSDDLGASWITSEITGTLVTSNPQQDNVTIDTSEWVVAVKVINDTLWVGTTMGAAKVALEDFLAYPENPDWDLYRVKLDQEVFAYPVPFSPINQGLVYFNYPMKQSGYVTIKIYDFAMNLVKTAVDNEYREGGEEATYSTDSWDGRNGRGDAAAAGIYYFKVEYSTGGVNWGKLAIIP